MVSGALPHSRSTLLWRLTSGVGAAALCCLLASCSATYDEKVGGVRQAFERGDLAAARAIARDLLAEAPEGHPYRSCLLLEEGLLEIASGEPGRAEESLRAVRDEFDRIEEEEIKAIFGEMATYFTDDRFRSYGGEDYEKILIRVMLGFANLLGDGGDVIAYSNQVLEKQRQIMEQEAPDRSGKKYKSEYRQIGAGAYMYGMITEENDPSAASEAEISYRRVKDWEPQFTSIDRDLERVATGLRAPAGHGVLYVFALVGRGPQKVEVVVEDLAAVTEIVSQMSRAIPEVREHYGATLDLSPIKIHEVRPHPNNPIGAIAIDVDGKPVGLTETLTDITRTAVQQYRITRDWVLAKAVLRRMTKKAVTTAIKGTASVMADKNYSGRDADTARFLIELGGIAANTIWSALERADTRYWSLLPDRIQVLRVELPVGEHEVLLTPRLATSGEGVPRSVSVQIRAAENSYVLGFIPTPGAGPAPRTTHPAPAPPLARVSN